MPPDHQPISRMEILRTFLAFGLLSFGGPAAHLALMQRELVERRKWLDHEEFLTMLAAINLVPGPNSTEMAFHIGLHKGGLWGQVLAAIGFTLPSILLSIGAAMVYVAAGGLPHESPLWRAIQGILIGVKPVILVLILSAAYRLGKKALDNATMWILFGGAMLIVLLTIAPIMNFFSLPTLRLSELLLLLLTGILYVALRRGMTAVIVWFLPLTGIVNQVLETIRPTALDLFGRFVLIGATLFGSGYILAAYMERHFVTETGWLTSQQLIDTLAIGQLTPGPVLSTSAAAGFVMTATPTNLWTGILPAFLSAVGVFLPAFIIVLILGKFIPLVKRSALAQDFLKGVNVGVIALLVGAFISLAWGTLVRPQGGTIDGISLVLTGLAFYASERRGWSPLGLVMAGICVGLLRGGFNWL